jgi:hypothetical protein
METPSIHIANISNIASALGVSRMAVNNRKLKYNWLPTNEVGAAAFDINTVPGLKPEERDRIRNYLEAQATSKRFQEERKRDLDAVAAMLAEREAANNTPTVYTKPPEKPVLNNIAAQLGTEAGRKLKEKETAAIEDAQQRKAQYMAMFLELPEKSRQVAEAKHQMVEALENFLNAGGFKGRIKDGKQCWNWNGVQKFCDAFIDGSLNMPAAIAAHFTVKGKRSLVPVSLNNWRKQYEDQGLYGLADHYASRKGQTSLSIEQQEFCVSMFTEKPNASIRSLCKAMSTRFKGFTLPERTAVKRFLDNWKARHESFHLFITNPDAWKNKYMFAFGNASENITRLNQRWESDCTPADIMCTDGRANIVGIIDVWSRRLKLLVSPTSKSSAIGMLLRRCILDWGMIEEEFRTDNGSDFTSFYIERVLDLLNVHHHLCAPFTPEQKPHIERAFKTFSHGILPLLDGFVGHNIVDRKAIESRKTFAKRLMTKGETVEINMTSADLQRFCDRWVDAMYHQETHSSLGMSPIAKFRSWTELVKRISNEHALDVLLSPAPSNDGWRVITKKGLAVTFGAAQLRYISADFVGHEGKRVRVLIDATDLGHASIFQEDGSFLCIAQDPTWIGISNEEVARHAKQRQKEQLAELRQDYKELAKRANVGNIAEEILRDREERAAKVADLPKPSTEYTSPALKQAAIAVDERHRQAANPALTGIIELPPEVLESEAREACKVVNLTVRNGRPRYFAGQGEIYDWLFSQMKKGQADEMERAWLADYEYMLNNPNKWDCKRGLMTEDPYLLTHWGRAQQAVGQ